MSQQPTQICDNCLKHFPESKIATHFGYCRRNIKKCPKCSEMYDINFEEQHEEEYHKMGSCKYCKKQYKPNEMTKHQDNCDLRTKYCEYCDLDVPVRDYPSHLRECEARTKQCDKCRKPIANKQYLIHSISCPGYVQEIKPSISSNTNNQYQDYQYHLKQQKKKEQLKRNQYKPTYPQPKREGSRGRQTRPQQGYSNNMYGNSNGLRQAEIKKQVIISNKPISSQTKPPSYADIKMNSNAIKYSDQRIPASNIYEKDLRTKVESNSNKNIDSNKNIGSGKIIENKYIPSVVPQVKPVNEYRPSVNNYGMSSKDVPKTVVQPSTNNGRTYQPPQMNINTKPGQNLPSKNYPKVTQTYKREVPSSKEVVYGRREEKPKQVQPRIAEYQYGRQEPRRQEPRRQDPRKYQQPQRNMPKTNVIPVQQYSTSQQPRPYFPQQHTPTYHHDSGVNDQEMDEELQKAIIASLGNVSISSPKNPSQKTSKPSYKIDEIPPELLENDMMNESFYGKQQALWEEFEKNKKRR